MLDEEKMTIFHMQMKETPKEIKPINFLEKAQQYCSTREVCQYDLFQKLQRWSASIQESNEIIATLISLNFINEERFAIAYAHDKSKFKKWSKKKIEYMLKNKRISSYSIQKALKNITDDDTQQKIKALIAKKYFQIKKGRPTEKEQKVIRFLLGRGFEYKDIERLLKNFMLELDSEQ